MSMRSASTCFPPLLTPISISQTAYYNVIDVQATVVGVTLTEDKISGFATESASINTQFLYADLVCYGTDAYYDNLQHVYILLSLVKTSQDSVESFTYILLSPVKTSQDSVESFTKITSVSVQSLRVNGQGGATVMLYNNKIDRQFSNIEGILDIVNNNAQGD